MKKLSGECLCGSVEYSITDDLIYSGYCHCSECRRWTGAPFSATAGVRRSEFNLLKGQSVLSSFKKGNDSESYFCSECSSIIYGVVPEHNMIYVMMGTLRESPSLKPQWHIYTGSKVGWYTICDDLPQYINGPNLE